MSAHDNVAGEGWTESRGKTGSRTWVRAGGGGPNRMESMLCAGGGKTGRQSGLEEPMVAENPGRQAGV